MTTVDWQNTDSIWHAHPSNHRLQPGGSEYETRYAFVRQQIEPGSKVLDIGCNCGQLAENLVSDLGCEVVGIDIVDKFVAYCNRNKPLVAYCGDASDLDMAVAVITKHGRFDYVTALEVIEHPIEVEGFARNLTAFLEPGGRFVVTTPHPDGVYGWRYMETHPHHVRMWSRESLEATFGPAVVYEELYRDGETLEQIGAVFSRMGIHAAQIQQAESCRLK